MTNFSSSIGRKCFRLSVNSGTCKRLHYGVIERRSVCALAHARADAFLRNRWIMTVVSTILMVILPLSSNDHNARIAGHAVDGPTLPHREYPYFPNRSNQAGPARLPVPHPTCLVCYWLPFAYRQT